MSPLNRGPLMGPRMPPVSMRPMPPPRFGGRMPLHGMPHRLPPPPMSPMFGPMRQRMLPPRPGGPPPLYGPRLRGMPPMMPPMMGPRGIGPRGPLMRPGPRGMLPPQGLPHMRPRFPPGGGNIKGKGMNNAKKVSKLEELELKKPWMTDEIRSEIQKKNKLYAKAKKNKDAKEWEEFKDVRNKVTRMIRDAKNEYLAKHPEQAHLYSDDEPYDERDENYESSEDERDHYCEVCDREFPSDDCLVRHKLEHKVCGIDGCVFSAHPKLIEKHISMQHYTGLYHRMRNLSTPEDIQKWIMERKKRYPTKANIEQRQAGISEKQQRGEMIKEKYSVTQLKTKKEEINKGRKRKTRRRPGQVPHTKATQDMKLYRGLLPFPGTITLEESNIDTESSLIEDLDEEVFATNPDEISDDDTMDLDASCTTNVSLQTTLPSTSNNVNLSLVANYGTDSNEDDGPDEVPIKKIKTDTDSNESVPTVTEPGTNQESSHSQSKSIVQEEEREHTEKFEKGKGSIKNKYQKTNQNRQHDRHDNQRNRKQNPKKLQLLNRLLSRSIQHERNLVCQCIKYIVDNNFFE